MDISQIITAPVHYTVKIFADSDAAYHVAKMTKAIIGKINPAFAKIATWYDSSVLKGDRDVMQLKGTINTNELLQAAVSPTLVKLYTIANHVVLYTSAHFWLKQIDKLFTGKALFERGYLTPFGAAATCLKISHEARDGFEFLESINLGGISKSVGQLFGYKSFEDMIPEILDHRIGIISYCLDVAHQIEIMWIHGFDAKGVSALIKVTADIAKSCGIIVIYIEGFGALSQVKFWCLIYASSCALLTHCIEG
jgi:hypothetical protein